MMDRMLANRRTPSWWTDKHSSLWEQVKGALERDWAQTKADFSAGSGEELNQNLADTVLQSVGVDPIPAPGVKTRPTEPTKARKQANKARAKLEKTYVKAADAVSQANDELEKGRRQYDEDVNDAHEELATKQHKANDKIAAANAKAGDRMAEAYGKSNGDVAGAYGKASDEVAHAHDKASADVADARSKASDQIAHAHVKAAVAIAAGNAKIEEASAERYQAYLSWQEAESVVRYGFSVRSQYPANTAWNNDVERRLQGEWEALGTGMPWKSSKAGIRRGWDFASKEG